MHIARELARHFDVTPPAIPVSEMVDVFPRGAPPEFAARFYGQAYQMVEFLLGFCKTPTCKRDWVAKLLDGAAPSTFFESTIRELAPPASDPPRALWEMYFDGLVERKKSLERGSQ